MPSLEQYNMEQFITVPVPGQSHQVCEHLARAYAEGFNIIADLLLHFAWQVIISQAGKLLGEARRYIDPRSHTSFELDHIRLVGFEHFTRNPEFPIALSSRKLLTPNHWIQKKNPR